MCNCPVVWIYRAVLFQTEVRNTLTFVKFLIFGVRSFTSVAYVIWWGGGVVDADVTYATILLR